MADNGVAPEGQAAGPENHLGPDPELRDAEQLPGVDPELSDTPGPRRDSAFVRGLRVLTEVAESGEVRAGELASRLGLPLSTTYRYLKALRDFDLVEDHAGRFIPGWRLSAWSSADIARGRLLEIGREVLTDLSERSGRTSVLAVRAGHHVVCLREVVSAGDHGIALPINRELPLDRGAGQRVLLAHAPPAIIEGVIRSRTDPESDRQAYEQQRERLHRELALIRQTGFAVSEGELKPGAHAVAAPVFLGGEVVCSLGLAGAKTFSGSAGLTYVQSLLTEACRNLSARLESETGPRERGTPDLPAR